MELERIRNITLFEAFKASSVHCCDKNSTRKEYATMVKNIGMKQGLGIVGYTVYNEMLGFVISYKRVFKISNFK